MSKLRLMSGHGDLCVAEWEVEQPATVDLASEAFRQHQGRGCLAFRIDGPGQTERIREFDSTAPEILLVPAVQGG